MVRGSVEAERAGEGIGGEGTVFGVSVPCLSGDLFGGEVFFIVGREDFRGSRTSVGTGK